MHLLVLVPILHAWHRIYCRLPSSWQAHALQQQLTGVSDALPYSYAPCFICLSQHQPCMRAALCTSISLDMRSRGSAANSTITGVGRWVLLQAIRLLPSAGHGVCAK